MSRPLLLLDVDGVLALRGRLAETASLGRGVEWRTVVSAVGDNHRVGLRPIHGEWIRTLARSFEIVWATGWEHDAPRILGPLLGIPDFDVLEFSQKPSFDRPLAKTPDVVHLVRDRAAAWVDDDLDDAARNWAAQDGTSRLLIRPDPTVGLTLSHVTRLVAFAQKLDGKTVV